MMGPVMGGVARMKFAAATTAMTIDGNSIMDPVYSDLATQLKALAPISNQFTITNRGKSGQTTRDMINTASDVDGAFVSGKRNVLLVWELTNSIHNQGRTGAQVIADTIEYINARQAYIAATYPGEKWVIVLMTGIPRGSHKGSFWSYEQGEVHMQYCNTYIRENYRAMGAVAYVEARRAGGPFDFTDVLDANNFPAALWTDRTHPTNGAGGGKSILAGYIADTLKRLPAR